MTICAGDYRFDRIQELGYKEITDYNGHGKKAIFLSLDFFTKLPKQCQFVYTRAKIKLSYAKIKLSYAKIKLGYVFYCTSLKKLPE